MLLAVLAFQFGQASAATPVTLTLVSGASGVGTLDADNEVSTDNGANWTQANVVAEWVNGSQSWYGPITGTDFIYCSSDISDSCGANTTTLFRATFDLPAGFNGPSLSVGFVADNQARVFLNGNVVGTGAFAGGWNTLTNQSTNTASDFVAGTNELVIELNDVGAPAGLDYEATVVFTPLTESDPPPASVETNQTPEPGTIIGFEEQSGVVLQGPLTVLSGIAPSPTQTVTIPAGTAVDSYYLHYHPGVSDSITGSITFDQPVLGVIRNGNDLQSTDSDLGATGTEYGGTGGARGSLEANDSVFVDPSSNTVTVNLNVSGNFRDDVRIVLLSPNAPPTAEANGPYDVDEGSSVQLSSAGSSDDDAIVAYDWDLDNNGSFETPGASPNFSAVAIDGTTSQTVVLRVTDSEGETHTDSATVNINNVAPYLALSDPNTAYYVDWTAANPGAGTASGTITLADGSTIGVGFEAEEGDYHAAQIGPAPQADYWGDAEAASPGTHISAEVPNLPDTTDILRLEGDPGTTYTVTLSAPVVDPIMLIHSLGNPWAGGTRRYDFDSPFSIVSQNGNLGQEPGDVLTGAEGNGTIKFLGTFQTFSWTMPVSEYWHGFTFAVGGSENQAGTTVDEGQTASHNGTWDDVPGDSNVTVSASVGSVITNPNGTWNWSLNTNDGPAQSQTVTITANDHDGDISQATFPLVVANVAPTAALVRIGPKPLEGSPVNIRLGNRFDPSSVDTSTLRYSFACDGNVASLATSYATAGTSFQTTCVFDDNGPQVVRGRIFDKDGGINTYAGVLRVGNVAPTVDADDATVTVNEGQTAENTGTFSDPGDDTVTITATDALGDPIGDIVQGAGNAGDWSWSFDTTDGPAESTTVTITADDGEGATTEMTFELVVDNVAPKAGFGRLGPKPVEGSPVTLVLSNGSDPSPADASSLRYSFACDGDVNSLAASYGDADPSNTGVCEFADDGIYPVKGRVFDKDGGFRTRGGNVTVLNLDPTFTFDFGKRNITIPENGFATVSGTYSDPGILDEHTGTVDWADGSTSIVTTTSDGAGTGTGTWSATRQFLDDDPTGTTGDTSTYWVTISDLDGGSSQQSGLVHVRDQKPTVTFDPGFLGVQENNWVTVSGGYTDVGTLDIHTATIDWDEGAGPVELTLTPTGPGTGTFSATHQYLDDNPTNTTADWYFVKVAVTDDDLKTGKATKSVRVKNVRPVLVPIGDIEIFSGQEADLTAFFTDQGTQDTHTATVDWGTGPVSASVAQGAGSGTITASEQFFALGDHPVTVRVEDDDKGAFTRFFTVTVTRAPMEIDVKPGSSVNPLNLNGNGVVPIAVLGSDDVDVTTLIVGSILAGATGDVEIDEATPMHGGHFEFVNDDNILDLVLHFREGDLGLSSDLPAFDVRQIYLTAESTEGVYFIGQDDVRINPNNSSSKGKDIKGPKKK